MLWTIFIILMILWLLGIATSYTLGGFIHILLLLAIASVLIRIRPAGATIRVQMLPNPSRKLEIGTKGVVAIGSGTTGLETIEGWIRSMRIMGVGWTHS